MLNIGILFGGKSCEHDISIISMLQIKELLKDKYNLYILYMDKDNSLYLANNMNLIDFKKSNYSSLIPASFVKYGISVKKKVTLIDSMILLNHGINGEDGLTSALMEYYDINYVGSPMYASVVAMDKEWTYHILNEYGIKQVDRIIYNAKDYYDKKEIEYDECIIKPAHLGSSIGINICHNKKDIYELISKSFVYDNKLVIEKLLKGFKEYNIALYKTDKVYFSNILEIDKKNDFLSFTDKYVNNNKNKNYDYVSDKKLVKNIKDMAIRAYNALDMNGIVRIDFILHDDILYLNEINTIPGGLSYYLFDDFNEVIDELIKFSIIKKGTIKNRLDTSILGVTRMKK